MKFKTLLYLFIVFIAPINMIIAQVPGFDDNVDDIGPSAPIDDYILPVLFVVFFISIGLMLFNSLSNTSKKLS